MKQYGTIIGDDVLAPARADSLSRKKLRGIITNKPIAIDKKNKSKNRGKSSSGAARRAIFGVRPLVTTHLPAIVSPSIPLDDGVLTVKVLFKVLANNDGNMCDTVTPDQFGVGFRTNTHPTSKNKVFARVNGVTLAFDSPELIVVDGVYDARIVYDGVSDWTIDVNGVSTGDAQSRALPSGASLSLLGNRAAADDARATIYRFSVETDNYVTRFDLNENNGATAFANSGDTVPERIASIRGIEGVDWQWESL